MGQPVRSRTESDTEVTRRLVIAANAIMAAVLLPHVDQETLKGYVGLSNLMIALGQKPVTDFLPCWTPYWQHDYQHGRTEINLVHENDASVKVEILDFYHDRQEVKDHVLISCTVPQEEEPVEALAIYYGFRECKIRLASVDGKYAEELAPCLGLVGSILLAMGKTESAVLESKCGDMGKIRLLSGMNTGKAAQ